MIDQDSECVNESVSEWINEWMVIVYMCTFLWSSQQLYLSNLTQFKS